MLKIEFDPTNTRLALAIGKALVEYAKGCTDLVIPIRRAAPGGQLTDEENAALTGSEADLQTDGEITGAAGAAEQFDKDVTKDVATTTTTDKPTHDEKGVQFIPAICGQATDPFYSTGANKGQWKKRKGVDPAEYDRVYGEALAALTPSPSQGYQAPQGGQTERFDTIQENTANTSSATETFAGQQQTNVGQDVANSSAAQVFGGGSDPITETVNEIPATPAEVFELYSEICQKGGAGVANQICATAGIANGTLIFSRPDLAPRLYKELTAQKAQLVGG